MMGKRFLVLCVAFLVTAERQEVGSGNPGKFDKSLTVNPDNSDEGVNALLQGKTNVKHGEIEEVVAAKDYGDQILSNHQPGLLKKNIEDVEQNNGALDELLLAQTPVKNFDVSWVPDTSGDDPWLVKHGPPIFKFEEVDLTDISQKTNLMETMSASDSETKAKEIVSKVGGEVSYLAFTGAADVSLKRNSFEKFKTFRFDRYQLYTDKKITKLITWNDLQPSVQEGMLTQSPEDIVSNYGQFYATSITLGGMYIETIIIDMVNKDKSVDLDTAVKGSYGITGAKASASAENGRAVNLTVDNRKSQMTVRTLGGDAKIFGKLHDDRDNQEELTAKWIDSIGETNLVVVERTLRPLWDLYNLSKPEHQKKKTDLEEWLTGEWTRETNEITPRPEMEVDPLFYPGVTIDLLIKIGAKYQWCWTGGNKGIYCNKNWDWHPEARFLVEEAGYKKIRIKGGPEHNKKYCQVREDNIVRCDTDADDELSAVFIVESFSGGWFHLKNERSGKYCVWSSRRLTCEQDEADKNYGSFKHHVKVYPKVPATCTVTLCREKEQKNCDNEFEFGPGRYDVNRLSKVWKIKSLKVQENCSAAVYRDRWLTGYHQTYTANVSQLPSTLYNLVGSLKVCSKYYDDDWEKCGKR